MGEAHERPRVLLACDWFVRYTTGLAGGLRDQGSAVALLTRAHDTEFAAVPGAMRAHIAGELGPGVPHLRIGRRVRDPRAVVEVVRLAAVAGRFGPDVVHLQDSVVNDPRLLAVARARPRRYALTVHDVVRHPGDPPMTLRQRAVRHALIRRAGLVFVHAEALRERLIAEQRPGGAVVVVPHGTEVPSTVAPLPEQPALLMFGRMSHYKGLDTLLDAMPLVWEQLPAVRLTIAGRGRAEAHPCLADGRVLVRDRYVPDAEVPALFAGATCVVLPYREASQSGVAALAKRHGRGLVVTDVGGLPELARDGTARLVAPEDPRALAEAVLTVLRSPGLAERMACAAAGAARGESSWSRVAEATLAAYDRHLGVD
jgi:glycosyltransferase involved in cell wall biosynthesis